MGTQPEDARQAEGVTCLRCGGRHLMDNVAITTTQSPLRASTWRMGFLRVLVAVHGDVTARVCVDCGHTELITGNLAEMWEAYSQQNR